MGEFRTFSEAKLSQPWDLGVVFQGENMQQPSTTMVSSRSPFKINPFNPKDVKMLPDERRSQDSPVGIAAGFDKNALLVAWRWAEHFGFWWGILPSWGIHQNIPESVHPRGIWEKEATQTLEKNMSGNLSSDISGSLANFWGMRSFKSLFPGVYKPSNSRFPRMRFFWTHLTVTATVFQIDFMTLWKAQQQTIANNHWRVVCHHPK